MQMLSVCAGAKGNVDVTVVPDFLWVVFVVLDVWQCEQLHVMSDPH